MSLSSLKGALQSAAPKLYDTVQPVWTKFRLGQREQQLARIQKAVVAHCESKVMAGPFAGMSYVPEAINSGLLPKFLGCYEDELAPAVAEILTRDYTAIVDVGSAEGYYAVGFALRFPQARVYAFDIDPVGQRLVTQMAQANGVSDRVIVGSECNPERLKELQDERLLLISDCEGYEIDLLRPDLVPGLARADILVELHDCFNPQITPAILPRFQATHDITLFDSRRRDGSKYPEAQFLPPADRDLAVDDLRMFPQQWAWMTPKRPSAGGDSRPS